MLLSFSILCSISVHTDGGRMNGEGGKQLIRVLGSRSLYLPQSFHSDNQSFDILLGLVSSYTGFFFFFLNLDGVSFKGNCMEGELINLEKK